MKKKSLLALLAIPLAGLGIVGSAALAANKAQTPVNDNVQTQQSVDVQNTQNQVNSNQSDPVDGQETVDNSTSNKSDGDIETNDDQNVKQDKETNDDNGQADVETNDDVVSQ